MFGFLLVACAMVAQAAPTTPGVSAYCDEVATACELSGDAGGVRRAYRLAGVRVPTVTNGSATREAIDNLRRRALHRDVIVVEQPQIPVPGRAALVRDQSTGLLVNEAVIGDGFAFFDPSHDLPDEVAALLRAAEERARDKRLGLWGPADRMREGLGKPVADAGADSLLKTGDNLRPRNPAAAREWYERILKESPRSTASIEARKRLKLPAHDFSAIPPLTADLVLELASRFPTVAFYSRPGLPEPPPPRTSPAPTTAVVDKVKPADRASTYVPSYSPPRTSSSRKTPGTEVQVKGYYRKNGTYVAPHTRSRPRRR